MANVQDVVIPSTLLTTTAAEDWRRWLLPFVAVLFIASLIFTANDCDQPRDPGHGIPAKSTKPMKD